MMKDENGKAAQELIDECLRRLENAEKLVDGRESPEAETFQDLYSEILVNERSAAQIVIDALDDAEDAARRWAMYQEERRRRIIQAGPFWGILTRLRYKVGDWIALLKIEYERARKRQQEQK